MKKVIIAQEEIKKLPIEERERIISKMSDREIRIFLGLKPTPSKLVRKHPHESAAQVVRRLRTQVEKGVFVL